MERLKKFNGGKGAILCNGCLVIVKEGFGNGRFNISAADWKSKEPLFCFTCEERRRERKVT